MKKIAIKFKVLKTWEFLKAGKTHTYNGGYLMIDMYTRILHPITFQQLQDQGFIEVIK
jgi:hypothetical protein